MPDQKPFPFRLSFPPELPISGRAEEIVSALQNHQVIVLAGETGSGKTTQIPKLCLAAGRGKRGRIACTQPRRVAALSVSRRVAEETNVGWGKQVGCKVRFEDRTSKDTVVKFMTDGMLLAEAQADPRLCEYDTIIVDEAHERSLNIDFILGHLRQLVLERPDLKVVITSATIDTAAFSKAFEGAPIIEVSGRTYPVEVVYAPLDELGEENEKVDALHYIDGAIEAAERILATTRQGDLLIFMPAERDIRETIEGLARTARGCDVIPLFGRLTNAEQQRVFAPTQKRRVIVATNIAETSLTLPGIRYVIDTGLARVSRYVAQSRTRRLPIEPVAQSSADQRKGRAGRVAEGVCIRLYSEKDFNERPRFAQPEIQRANLADVILRMKAFGLGDIERFPFINQPATKAVRAGYLLLEELHAIERDGPGWKLTDVGHDLAALPVDPSVGRMILQARGEKALREVVIVASGLSIQDPRERPLDQQAAADAAHRRFTHRESDFLTLLAIWEGLHEEFERLSQSKMRRWCKAHFLSYPRMREWRDIYAQLHDVLKSRRDLGESSVWSGGSPEGTFAETTLKLGLDDAAYRVIHRSVLAGLLGNVATRDDTKPGYKATHERRANIFPGSGLFVREAKATKNKAQRASAKNTQTPKSPRWIMCSEYMETSRVFARTCGRIDPRWIKDLGEHLLKRTYRDPFWDESKGRVMVRQRTTLYGLEVEMRSVSYSKINPAEATEIFIREGLVNDTVTWPFDFTRHNREVRTRLENELTRRRNSGMMNLDEAVYRFYASRLSDVGDHVSAVGELVALVKERKVADPRYLEFDAADLGLDDQAEDNSSSYPESLPLANSVLPLTYSYQPGEAEDGVTLQVGVSHAEALSQSDLDWAVPGYLEGKIEFYVKALPKEIRRLLVPLTGTTQSLTSDLRNLDPAETTGRSLQSVLAERIGARCSIRLDPQVWQEKPLPEHWRVRVVVEDGNGKPIVSSRDLAVIKEALRQYHHASTQRSASDNPSWWRKACKQWESERFDAWPDRDVPSEIQLTTDEGTTVIAYPVVVLESGERRLRLLRDLRLARSKMEAGIRAALAHAIRRDLGWMEKDLKALREVAPLAASFYPWEEMRRDALSHLERALTDPDRFPAKAGGRSAEQFEAVVMLSREDSRRFVPQLVDDLRGILDQRQQLMVAKHPYPNLEKDVSELVGRGFLRSVDHMQLRHLRRYLQARLIRLDRWRLDPTKDAERDNKVRPFVAACSQMTAGPSKTRLRWLIEEYRVSLWAQKLGTAEPVSAKKLQAMVEDASPETPKTAPQKSTPDPKSKPLVMSVPSSGKKVKPLKSLNALGGLFKPPG